MDETTFRQLVDFVKMGEAGLVSPETRRRLGSQEFQQACIAHAKRDALTRSGMILFVGIGDLANHLIAELKQLDSGIVAVGIDSKITVGVSVADYVLFLLTNPDDQDDHDGHGLGLPGLLDTERLIDLLRALAPQQGGLFNTTGRVVNQMFRATKFASLRERPMLVGDYHGFAAREVFAAASKLGYQVLPDARAATLAMDKAEFWERYGADPTFSPHLLHPTRTFTIPTKVAAEFRMGTHGEARTQLVAETRATLTPGSLPVVVKPSISEFGYGQARIDDAERTDEALATLVSQCDRYLINPGGRVLMEPFAQRKIDPHLSGTPIELMQIIARHRNPRGQVVTTCLPPIWFTNHPPRPYADTHIIAGPQVFDFAIQAPVASMTGVVSAATYATIQDCCVRLIESLTAQPGLFGVEIFLLDDGTFTISRLTVRTQDTMFATISSQPLHHAFRTLARIVLNERISPDELSTQQHIGGVKTIIYMGDKTGIITDFVGEDAVEEMRYVERVEVYPQKRELRPLRRYGLIYVRAPIDTSIEEVVRAMASARDGIRIVAETA